MFFIRIVDEETVGFIPTYTYFVEPHFQFSFLSFNSSFVLPVLLHQPCSFFTCICHMKLSVLVHFPYLRFENLARHGQVREVGLDLEISPNPPLSYTTYAHPHYLVLYPLSRLWQTCILLFGSTQTRNRILCVYFSHLFRKNAKEIINLRKGFRL